MAPIEYDDEEIQGLGQSKVASDAVKKIVQEKAKPKVDPKTSLEAVFAGSLIGLTHPVSPNEEQMLQLHTQAPLANNYNTGTYYHSQYPVDAACVLKAIEIMSRRHDILRSTYHMGSDATPVKRLNAHVKGYAVVVNCNRAMDIQMLIGLENQRPFQLGVSSSRFMVTQVNVDKGKLESEVAPGVWINMHHCAADADGALVASTEMDQILGYLFRGFSEESVMEMLPKISVQFSDYAYWQYSLEAKGLLVEDLSVWYQSVTSSCPPMVLDMAADFPRARMFTQTGSESKIRMEHEVIAPIMAACPTTPYSVVFCAFHMALNKLSGQSRVHCAIPYGTRANPSLYPLIGSFLNMLPCSFEYHASDSFGATLDRCSELQLAARKYALAPFLTTVNMLRPHSAFDPSRNPVYQAMCDMLPMSGGDEEQESMGGVLDILCFPMAPNGQMRHTQVAFNNTIFKKNTSIRCLMLMKEMIQIAANQASQSVAAVYSQTLPAVLGDGWESSAGASLGSFPLKIYTDSGEEAECNVNLAGGFAPKGTPEEYEFYRRSSRFARHSGVMPTTDPHHSFAKHYQLPPIIPQKRGQTVEQVKLPEIQVDQNYSKISAKPVLEWPAADAAPATKPTKQEFEGIVDFWDAENGSGVIKCPSVDEDIPFFKLSVPTKNRTRGVYTGASVAFSYYGNQGSGYATAVRFTDEKDY